MEESICAFASVCFYLGLRLWLAALITGTMRRRRLLRLTALLRPLRTLRAVLDGLGDEKDTYSAGPGLYLYLFGCQGQVARRTVSGLRLSAGAE